MLPTRVGAPVVGLMLSSSLAARAPLTAQNVPLGPISKPPTLGNAASPAAPTTVRAAVTLSIRTSSSVPPSTPQS